MPSCSLVSSQLARLNPSRAAQRIQLACLTSHLAMAEDCESSEVESSLAEAANLLGKMENAKAIAFSIEAELAATRAKYLLAAHQTDRARSTISEALAKVSVVDEVRSHEDCTALAWLHHYMGVAIAQQLESLEGTPEFMILLLYYKLLWVLLFCPRIMSIICMLFSPSHFNITCLKVHPNHPKFV